MNSHLKYNVPNNENATLKYHIYNINGEPLCWNNQAIEFDTYFAAEDFLFTAGIISGNMYEPHSINDDILFYDGGHINLTNYLPAWNDVGDEIILIERKLK